MKYRNKPRAQIGPHFVAGIKLLFWFALIAGVIGGIIYCGKTYPEQTGNFFLVVVCLALFSPFVLFIFMIIKAAYLDLLDIELRKRNLR